jgi:hypothetical protein
MEKVDEERDEHDAAPDAHHAAQGAGNGPQQER